MSKEAAMHGNKGRKQSPEHIAKRMAAWKKSSAPKKAGKRFSELNKSRKGVPLPEDQKDKIAKSLKGKKNSLGCIRSAEFRLHLSEVNKGTTNTPWYVDGKYRERVSERVAIMRSVEYRIWVSSVLRGGNYTCAHCGNRGGWLHAHHIKSFAYNPELRLSFCNGQVLCVQCHRAEHKRLRDISKENA